MKYFQERYQPLTRINMMTPIYVLNSNAEESNTMLLTKQSTLYKVLNYDSNYVCFDDEDTGKYRSVIFNKTDDELRLVSFSPPKSIPLSVFMEKHPTINGVIPLGVEITEIVEGTMIQLFYDQTLKTWEIATKSAIGGDYWYYRNYYGQDTDIPNQRCPHQMTFRQMFMEAIGEFNNTDLNISRLVRDLSTSCCYNFVLQHPQNHIVLCIDCPRVYLVAIYEIESNNARWLPLYMTVYNSPEMIQLCELGILHLPEYHEFSNHLIPSFHNGQTYFRSYEAMDTVKNKTMSPMGYMFVDTITGDRSAMTCEYYERLKEIRGNHPNLQYQYLCLLRTKKIHEFLHYFPMYKNMFMEFYKQLNAFVQYIHQGYIQHYIMKQPRPEFMSRHLWFHICRLHHEIYMPSISTNEKKKITRKVVWDYFAELEPAVVMFAMRQLGASHPDQLC